MIYSYQAKDRTGRTVTGALDAPDERQAAQEIRDMGYFPMRLAVQAGGAATLSAPSSEYSQSTGASAQMAMSPGRWLLAHLVFPVWSGVGLRDLALFYRQFSAMISAGVPIYQCLTTLERQTSNRILRGLIRRISVRVLEGGTLTAAMREWPWVFTDFHRAMIAAGEASGRMDVMMARLSSALEQEYTLRGSIKKETWYPVTTLVLSFLLPPLVLLIAPGGAAGFHEYVGQAVYPVLIAGGIVAGCYVMGKLLSQFRVAFDGIIASLPGIGGAVRMVALARFARALASLYAAGVAIPEALRFSAAATGNAFMAKRMVSAIPALQGGRGITEALQATRIFPPMVISMLGTGEQTGGLDATMDKVADYYEQESVVRLHQLSVTLGAFAMVVAGIRVAMIVGNFYTGYFDKMNDMANPDSTGPQ